MKNTKSKILIASILMAVLVFSFSLKPKISSAATALCSVQSATFTPNGTQGASWYTGYNQQDVALDIVTQNCAGRTIQVSITKHDAASPDDDISDLNNKPIYVPSDNHFTINMKAGETECNVLQSPDCQYYITIYKLDTPDYKSDGLPGGNLEYDCDTACLDSWVFQTISTTDTIDFDTNTTDITKVDNTTVTAKIAINNSEGGYIENKSIPAGANHGFSSTIGSTVPGGTASAKQDLAMEIAITKGTANTIVINKFRYPILENAPSQNVSINFNTLTINTPYVLTAEITDQSGNVKRLIKSFTINSTGVTSATTTSTTTNYIKNQFTSTPGVTENKYYPLATLPNIGQTCTTETDLGGHPLMDASGNPIQNCIDTSSPTAFGDYLNTMIKIFIAICAILAMIMIVVGGIQYMTSELISSKEGGRERITNAIIGLLIAVGAYALLNTINPQLLNIGIGNLPTATTTLQDEPQVPVNGKYSSKNLSLNVNDPWPATSLNLAPNQLDASVRADLATYGITVNKSDCTYVGQTGCTSLDGLDTSVVKKIATNCKATNGNSACNIIITGGTEFWLHNGGTSHSPGGTAVDLDAVQTSDLDKYITGDQYFVLDGAIHTKDGVNFLAEVCGQTKCTTAPHWHVE